MMGKRRRESLFEFVCWDLSIHSFKKYAGMQPTASKVSCSYDEWQEHVKGW
jgi:hypothetical protein